MTNYLFMWETADGNRCWEAVERDQAQSFSQKLLESGAVPSSVMVSFSPVFIHWLFPTFHNGLSDVCFGRVNEEIMGCDPVQESRHRPVETERVVNPLYGWIAPDGRFFCCDYGGHVALAETIVGKLEKVDNSEKFLEDAGWAKVSSGVRAGKKYSILMGVGKKLSADQLKTIQRHSLDSADGISLYL